MENKRHELPLLWSQGINSKNQSPWLPGVTWPGQAIIPNASFVLCLVQKSRRLSPRLCSVARCVPGTHLQVLWITCTQMLCGHRSGKSLRWGPAVWCFLKLIMRAWVTSGCRTPGQGGGLMRGIQRNTGVAHWLCDSEQAKKKLWWLSL